MRRDDTIFALSSGAPPAAIGIVRVSGPGAAAALIALAGPLPPPRRATLRTLRAPGDAVALDRALLLWFPAAQSATGEDLAEFHLHGGRAVIAALLAALGRREGLRPAEPGEFTRRAFLNGRIDLAEAEGLADLLGAETEAQRRHAMLIVEGGLSRQVERWRAAILALSARVEALLDFSDEDDVAEDDAIAATAAALRDAIAIDLATPPAERLRDGVRVVLAGPPNAGKSTLLNALVGREAAITAPRAGTTRDVIEAPVTIGGLPLLLSDTAGLRERSGAIESVGIARARTAIAQADIVLWLGSPSARARDDAIVVHAQADRPGRAIAPAGIDIALSARTGAGMGHLTTMLLAAAARLLPREGAIALNLRQRRELTFCCDELTQAARSRDLLLVAEHLRHARSALDRLTGRAGTEEMLDALFGTFCIGK